METQLQNESVASEENLSGSLGKTQNALLHSSTPLNIFPTANSQSPFRLALKWKSPQKKLPRQASFTYKKTNHQKESSDLWGHPRRGVGLRPWRRGKQTSKKERPPSPAPPPTPGLPRFGKLRLTGPRGLENVKGLPFGTSTRDGNTDKQEVKRSICL